MNEATAWLLPNRPLDQGLCALGGASAREAHSPAASPVDATAATQLPRLLKGLRADGRALSLAEHLRLHGHLPPLADNRHGAELLDELARSGLRGRGGAGFPVVKKLGSALANRSRPIVIANGCEGEPASAKDKVLLSRAPHLVLDGLAIVARIVGANKVFVAPTETTTEPLRAAIEERATLRADALAPQLVPVRRRFIAGESSALAHYVRGGPGLPVFTRGRSAVRGSGAQAALVQNVETLAHIALIARHGARWFRGLGTDHDPGSALVSLGGGVSHPAVYEVALGTAVTELLTAAGGLTMPAQAFLFGGYSGTWVNARDVHHMHLSEESLRQVGATLGPGIVVALSEDRCGWAETGRILTYLAAEGAGQCGPCTNGLPAMAATVLDLLAGTVKGGAAERLSSLAWQVRGRGACHHPDGAARLVMSALETFGADLVAHQEHGYCLATSQRFSQRGPLAL